MNKTGAVFDKTTTTLCLDTSFGSGLVALIHQGKVFEKSGIEQRQQASVIIPLIEELCEEASISKECVDMIALSVGPGSYTGIRIGISAAQALSKGLSVPIVALSNFDILSSYILKEYTPDQNFCVAIETMRQDSYVQIFDSKGEPMSKMEAIDDAYMEGYLDEYQVKHVYSNKCKKLRGILDVDKVILQEINSLSGRAFQKCLQNSKSLKNNGKITPIYLKAPDVSLSKKVFVSLK